jgi:hypothetical protein
MEDMARNARLDSRAHEFKPRFSAEYLKREIQTHRLTFQPEEFTQGLNLDKLMVYSLMLNETLRREMETAGVVFLEASVPIPIQQVGADRIVPEKKIVASRLPNYQIIKSALEQKNLVLLKLNLANKALRSANNSDSGSGLHTVFYDLKPVLNSNGSLSRVDVTHIDGLGGDSPMAWFEISNLGLDLTINERQLTTKAWQDGNDDRGMCLFIAYFLHKHFFNGKELSFETDNNVRYKHVAEEVIQDISKFMSEVYDTQVDTFNSVKQGQKNERTRLLDLLRQRLASLRKTG